MGCVLGIGIGLLPLEILYLVLLNGAIRDQVKPVVAILQTIFLWLGLFAWIMGLYTVSKVTASAVNESSLEETGSDTVNKNWDCGAFLAAPDQRHQIQWNETRVTVMGYPCIYHSYTAEAVDFTAFSVLLLSLGELLMLAGPLLGLPKLIRIARNNNRNNNKGKLLLAAVLVYCVAWGAWIFTYGI